MDGISIEIETVYSTLQASLSQDNSVRSAAEAQLRKWESDSEPGFIGSLLKVAVEDSRLLAVVVAKNAVGSNWRKTVGTREWSHVPEEEKQFVRSTAMGVLLQDPSNRVSMQAGLLITNIARFDFPRPWANLLADLAAAAAMESSIPIQAKSRALSAIKYILRALRSKRFIIEAPLGMTLQNTDDIEALGNQIDQDRKNMIRSVKELLGTLRGQWEGNFTSLLQRTPGWEARGALAVSGLAAFREVLMLLSELKDVENEFNLVLQEGAQAAIAVAVPLFSGQNGTAAALNSEDPHTTLLSKCWERLVQIAIVAMDRHTLAFAPHVQAWATLCVNTALLGMDAAAVHGIRPKSRVLLTRFIARAMLQPMYRRESPEDEASMLPLLPFSMQERFTASLPALRAAASCLDEILSEQDGRCAAMVQAVVSKYIVLAPEELEEWENDPEGYARQVDVETSPDADTPRPCGVALLECMLERAEKPVAEALVALASSLQSQPLTVEGVLPREAVYRAVGECFPHLRNRVDFKAWYAGELRSLLGPNGISGLMGSVLKARAIWLVGVCGDELRPEAWGEAFCLVVAHMTSADVVVALMAVSAAVAMISTVLEEQLFMSHPPEQQRFWMDGPDVTRGSMQQSLTGNMSDGSKDDLTAMANAEFQAHMSAIESQVDTIMVSCFALLPRLGEAESMVRVLQCVAATVELMGDRVAPHLGSITDTLPQVWNVLAARTEGGTGSLARLQCSLLAMLSHLISKLGREAAEDPKVSVVLLPLLTHATNVVTAEAETLVEDGLKLWLAVLKSASSLTPELQELITTRLSPVLSRGQDNGLALRIAEGYALHGGASAVAPILGQLAATIMSILGAANEAMQPKPTPQGSMFLGSMSLDLAEEALAAVSFLGVLHRVHDPLPAELEQPVRAAAQLVWADYGGGVLRLPARSMAVLESALEVVYRLTFRAPGVIAALTAGDTGSQNRLIDRWIALSSVRDVGEMFIPSLAAVGRVRRHNAAVALCALLLADTCPGMREGNRAAQSLVLGMKAAREQRLFEQDQQRLADLQPADPAHQDQLLLRRLLLARGDPLRGVDARDAVRTAAGHVEGWAGKEQLLSALEALDPMYKEQMSALLAGQLTESETDAAVLSMQHAALS